MDEEATTTEYLKQFFDGTDWWLADTFNDCPLIELHMDAQAETLRLSFGVPAENLGDDVPEDCPDGFVASFTLAEVQRFSLQNDEAEESNSLPFPKTILVDFVSAEVPESADGFRIVVEGMHGWRLEVEARNYAYERIPFHPSRSASEG